MRKLLIGVLLILLFVLLGGMMITGVSLKNFNLGYSVQAIINKNAELDNSITKLKTRVEQEYAIAKANLDASFKKLQTEKQNYQDTITLTSQEDLQAAQQTEEYKLGYLWTKIGLYATNNNLVLKVDVSHGSSGLPNQYNIAFTAIGSYIGVTDFVYDIEKDPSLGFRIEEFALIPYGESDGDISLQATFIIKNVDIDKNSLSQSANVQSGTVTTNQNNINNQDNTNNTNETNTNTNTANGSSSTTFNNVTVTTGE